MAYYVCMLRCEGERLIAGAGTDKIDLAPHRRIKPDGLGRKEEGQ